MLPLSEDSWQLVTPATPLLQSVAKAVWDGLVDEFLPVKAADWKEIALGLKERCYFPNWHHKIQVPSF